HCRSSVASAKRLIRSWVTVSQSLTAISRPVKSFSACTDAIRAGATHILQVTKSIQQIRLLADNLREERLKLKPPCDGISHLRAGGDRLIVRDFYWLPRRLRPPLRMATTGPGFETPSRVTPFCP